MVLVTEPELSASSEQPGRQDVHPHSRQDESGHAHNLVDLHRDGAHSVGNRRRQAEAAPALSQPALADRLVGQNARSHRPPDDLFGPRKAAGGELVDGHLGQFQVLGLQDAADRQGMDGDDQVASVDLLRPPRAARRPRHHLVEHHRNHQRKQQADGQYGHESAIHSFALTRARSRRAARFRAGSMRRRASRPECSANSASGCPDGRRQQAGGCSPDSAAATRLPAPSDLLLAALISRPIPEDYFGPRRGFL